MKTVIEMAREAGFMMENSAAIQAAERFFQAARAAGVAAENEACAELTEQMGIEGYGTLAIAAAIRARGNT